MRFPFHMWYFEDSSQAECTVINLIVSFAWVFFYFPPQEHDKSYDKQEAEQGQQRDHVPERVSYFQRHPSINFREPDSFWQRVISHPPCFCMFGSCRWNLPNIRLTEDLSSTLFLVCRGFSRPSVGRPAGSSLRPEKKKKTSVLSCKLLMSSRLLCAMRSL